MTEKTELTNPNAPLTLPVPGEGPAIWDLVMADMAERDAMGTRKYGQRLVAFDGRDPLVDAYQEALDLAVYLRKAIAQRGAETAPQPAPLSPGEQLVWAASFAHHVEGGTPVAIAARIATHRVQQLRELTAAEVEVLGRVGSRVGAAADVPSSTVLAAVEQMRGGR